MLALGPEKNKRRPPIEQRRSARYTPSETEGQERHRTGPVASALGSGSGFPNRADSKLPLERPESAEKIAKLMPNRRVARKDFPDPCLKSTNGTALTLILTVDNLGQ
jgi:hypothetical protein